MKSQPSRDPRSRDERRERDYIQERQGLRGTERSSWAPRGGAGKGEGGLPGKGEWRVEARRGGGIQAARQAGVLGWGMRAQVSTFRGDAHAFIYSNATN